LNSEEVTFSPERPTESAEYNQLQVDTMNVIQGLVELDSFPSEYQSKIKTNYRFYGYRYGSKDSFIAPRTRNTLEII